MKPSLKTYLVLLTAVTLVICLVLYFISGFGEDSNEQWRISVILLSSYYVFAMITGIILFRFINKRPGLFVRSFMGSSTVKFLLLMALLIVCILNFKEHRIFLTIIFFSLYLIYTVFEKTYIFKAFRQVDSENISG